MTFEKKETLLIGLSKSDRSCLAGAPYGNSPSATNKIQLTISSVALEFIDNVKEKYGYSRSQTIERLIFKYIHKEFGYLS